jgi:hypothetical protein
MTELAYGLKHAGHSPILHRMHSECDEYFEIRDICRKWLNLCWLAYDLPDAALYRNAVKSLSTIECSQDLVQSLLIDPVLQKDSMFYYIGLFVSAAANKEAGLTRHVTAAEAHLMAYSNSGVFINEGIVGSAFGDRSSGVIVNYGSTGDFGHEMTGMMVNFGKTGLLHASHKGLYIDARPSGFVVSLHMGRGIYEISPGLEKERSPRSGWPMQRKFLALSYSRAGDVYRGWSSPEFEQYVASVIDSAKRSPETLRPEEVKSTMVDMLRKVKV